MIDIDSLLKGAVYSELKESYVIFICTSDPFESGLPVYTFERKCREDAGVELKDETHHLIFNASAYEQENDPELRDFLSFVKNNTAESDFTRGIANMVQTKKFEQTFINEYLAWNLHDKDVELRGKKAGLAEGKKAGLAEGKKAGLAEGKKAGLAEGKKAGLAEGVRMTARNMLALNMSVETIAKATGLSVDEIKSL
jgi:predicted transposase/invertase (TIGR01784 family)